MAAAPAAINANAPASQNERDDADEALTQHKTARYHYQCNIIASSFGFPTGPPCRFNRPTYQPRQCKRWGVQEADGECNSGGYILGNPRLSLRTVYLRGGDNTKHNCKDGHEIAAFLGKAPIPYPKE